MASTQADGCRVIDVDRRIFQRHGLPLVSQTPPARRRARPCNRPAIATVDFLLFARRTPKLRSTRPCVSAPLREDEFQCRESTFKQAVSTRSDDRETRENRSFLAFATANPRGRVQRPTPFWLTRRRSHVPRSGWSGLTLSMRLKRALSSSSVSPVGNGFGPLGWQSTASR
jgi:hypothetical protein